MKEKKFFAHIFIVTPQYIFKIKFTEPIIYRQFFLLSKSFYLAVFNFLHYYKCDYSQFYLHHDLIFTDFKYDIDNINDFDYLTNILNYTIYEFSADYANFFQVLNCFKKNLLQQYKLLVNISTEISTINDKLKRIDFLASKQYELKASSIRQLKSIHLRRIKRIKSNSSNLYIDSLENVENFLVNIFNIQWSLF